MIEGEIIIFLAVAICMFLNELDAEDCGECYCKEESTEPYVEHDIRYYTVV